MAGIVRWLKFEWWMGAGRIDYKRRRHQAALNCFQQVTALYPNHLLAQSYIGACYMALQQYADAVSAFERGLQIKSDSAYCHAEIGRANLYLSKGQESFDSLKRAFRINPEYEKHGTYIRALGDALLALADNYARLPDYEISGKLFADAVRLLPESAAALHGLGWALRKAGRGEEAEAPLRKAIDLEPNDAAIHFELGALLHDMQRWTEAEEELRRAIELNPINSDQHHWLGWTLGRQERYSEEVTECLEAIRLDPEHREAYFGLGIAYTMIEEYERAVNAFESALRLNTEPSASLLACLASGYLQCKRWNDLLLTSQQLVKHFPDDPEGHFHLAYGYAELNRHQEAIQSYYETLRLQPDYFYAAANMALSYVKLDMLPEAVASFERAIELNPDAVEVRRELGNTYLRMGDLAQARKQLRILEVAGSDSAKELAEMIATASSHEPLTQESLR